MSATRGRVLKPTMRTKGLLTEAGTLACRLSAREDMVFDVMQPGVGAWCACGLGTCRDLGLQFDTPKADLKK